MSHSIKSIPVLVGIPRLSGSLTRMLVICTALLGTILSSCFFASLQPLDVFASNQPAKNGEILYLSQSTVFSHSQLAAINPDGTGGMSICGGLCRSVSITNDAYLYSPGGYYIISLVNTFSVAVIMNEIRNDKVKSANSTSDNIGNVTQEWCFLGYKLGLVIL